MINVVHTGIVSAPLDAAAIHAAVHDERCGATAVFLGTIRERTGSVPVVALEYTLRDIAEGLTRRQGVHRIEAWHRTGRLQVGEVAMVVAVAAEHRSQAFAAAQALVDEVKARLPVWKKQIHADGTHSWSGLENAR